MDRRRFLFASLAALYVSPARTSEPLRIGTTPVFLDERIGFLDRWGAYLASRLGREVRFVQRGSYAEIVDLLRASRLAAAWICGYPYVREEKRWRLLAVPVFQGQPLYQSYVIVPATDRISQTLLDLKGRVYAYSDPLSNSGWLWPQARLKQAGEDPARFFARSFFTFGHRRVVEAVAARLADGGSVDGYVWETLARIHPALTQATRVVERSPHFGFPPLVTPRDLDEATFRGLATAFLGMANDDEGRGLLATLNLDGFVPGSPALFDGIRASLRLVNPG